MVMALSTTRGRFFNKLFSSCSMKVSVLLSVRTCSVRNRYLSLKRSYSYVSNTSSEDKQSYRKAPDHNTRDFGQPTHSTHPHLLKEDEVTPNISRNEFAERRNNLAKSINKHVLEDRKQGQCYENHLCIIPAAAKQYMTNDIPYVYHQDSDFNYLSGFLETNSVLLLEFQRFPDTKLKSTLFVETKDELSQLWEGPCSGVEGGKMLTGVDECFDMTSFQKYVKLHLKKASNCALWVDNKNLENSICKEVVDSLKATDSCSSVEELHPLIQKLRLYKSKSEQDLMRKSCKIASEAIIEVMKCSHPFIDEGRMNARMEYECKIRGASGLAYPPVIAGGNRANTIHYINNNQVILPDELVLMDAGCEYNHYVSDITRTWPISGHFTDIQRVLYEILHEVQVACINVISGEEDITLEQIHYAMLYMLGQKLVAAHVIPNQNAAVTEVELCSLAQKFCPHHIGHYLGMDVHDTSTISRKIPLTPGMCVTIEPGIYIPHNFTDVPVEFRGMGMRIEDDVLINLDHNVEILTESCPKDIGNIECTIRNIA